MSEYALVQSGETYHSEMAQEIARRIAKQKADWVQAWVHSILGDYLADAVSNLIRTGQIKEGLRVMSDHGFTLMESPDCSVLSWKGAPDRRPQFVIDFMVQKIICDMPQKKTT